MKTFQETRILTRINTGKTDDEGQPIFSEKALLEAKFNELKEAHDKDASKPEPTAVKTVTFQYHEAETPADFEALVENEVERVNVFNRGYTIKQQSIVYDLMADADFEQPEGVYDLQKDAAEIRERKKATPEEKALKSLSELAKDPDALARVMAQFQAAIAAQTAAQGQASA